MAACSSGGHFAGNKLTGKIKNMHYANGREAKNGDRVMRITAANMYNKPVIGILHDAVVGNDTCNGNLAAANLNDTGANLSELLHIDDVIAAIGDKKSVKDTTK